MRFSVAARVYTVFALLIVLAFGIGGYIYVNEQNIDERVKNLVERRLVVRVDIARLSDLASSIRDLAVRIDDRRAFGQTQDLTEMMRAALAGGGAIMSRLAKAVPGTNLENVSAAGNMLRDALSKGGELAPAAVRYGEAADILNKSIASAIVEERKAVVRLNELSERNALIFAIAGLIIASAAMIYLYRNVIRRLLRLQSSMSAFVEGREEEIPTDGNDEIASMGRALDYLITTLKRREARLEEQLIFQRTLLDTIPNPIFYKDDNGKFTGANAAFEAVVGLPPDEVVGKTPYDLDRPDLAERYDPQDRGTGLGKKRYSYETEKAFADGKMHHVMIEKAHFMNADGKSTGVAGVMVDITRLKEAEIELHDAKEVAESANQAKSSFLAAMSHEIRTPMNGVTGMVELLEQTRLEREQRQMLRTVRESAEALLRIIDDILDFSKIEAGKMDLEHVPVSLSTIVNGVAETLAPNIRKQGRDVSLITFTDPDVPAWVKSDPVRLRQVLMNLAGNAAKFTEAGKVVISAEKVDSANGTVNVRFQVSDTGIGISKENQIKLFEAFTQAEGSITRRFGGTGLGLSISRRLVDLMGGRIGVNSELGKGSTFSFELPFEVSTPPSDEATDHALPALRDISVLICIPDAEEREIIETYLDHNGISHSVADTVGEMLERCAMYSVALIDDWPGSGGTADELASAIVDETAAQRSPGIIKLKNHAPASGKSKKRPGIVLQRPYRERTLIETLGVAAGRIEPGEVSVSSDADDRVPFEAPPSIDEARKAGRLILAVEDHPVNRQVLMRQLHTLGYAVEMAEDGAKALEKWQEGGYALVITDCHMPEMDGFELTAAIRAAEEATGHHTPIIAATANALQGEAENCLRAGMDGYLSKPVKLDALAGEIVKWLPDSGIKIDLPAPSADVPTSGDDVIDFAVLRAICHGDESMLLEMLGDFLEINQSVVDDLLQAIEMKKSADIRSHAHKLKGSAGTAGAKRLAEAAKSLEKSSGDGTDADIATFAHTLKTEFESVRAKIDSLKE
ncbi:MAG: response regulator [Rhodospirillales bacterium]|nr:response regulator [Rhodospirillales bacterium]